MGDFTLGERGKPPVHRATPLGAPLRGELLPQYATLDTVLESETLLVTFGFHCNLACTFCMVEDALDRYQGASLADMERFLTDKQAMHHIKRVTLSGGEATLEPNLLQYVAAAKRAGVAHVRIQTNATRLHDRGLLESLLASGVDEFFVSLHGADAATCDRITQRNGSFKAIVAGLRAIAASGARLVTNTAICQQNYTSLTSIVELAVAHQAAEVEFWNLWPRIDPEDLRGHLVPVAQAAPHLVAALDRAEELGRPATVKWFPRCLLGGRAIKLDNSQPNVLIEQEFWQDAPTYGCIHADTCAAAKDLTCLGLSKQYVDKYGWEAAALKPL